MGWNRKGWKDSCGGKEKTVAITPAGRQNIEGFFVPTEEPPSFTRTHKHARTHTDFDAATEDSLNKTRTCNPMGMTQKSLWGLSHDNSLMLNSIKDKQTSVDNLCKWYSAWRC